METIPILFSIHLNVFNIKFLARQNFRAETSAVRAKDYTVHRMIFFKTSHTLRFGSDKTKEKLGMFQWRAFAQLIPSASDYVLIELGDFTKCNSDKFEARRFRFLDDLIEERLCRFLFTHRMKLYIQ